MHTSHEYCCFTKRSASMLKILRPTLHSEQQIDVEATVDLAFEK